MANSNGNSLGLQVVGAEATQNGHDLVPLALPTEPTLPEGIMPFDRRAVESNGRPYRTSRYVIYVDLPEDEQSMLLVHSYTGAYDKVSRRVATYLRSLESGPAPKPLYGVWSPEPPIEGQVVPPSDAAVETLRKRGYLTKMLPAEEESYFAWIVSQFHHKAVHRLPGYILMVTYQCNLRCSYCFQDHMRTDPSYRHLLRFMDRKMVDRMFKGMAQIDRAHGYQGTFSTDRRFTFFGGEPLLAEARPTIDYIVEKAQTMGKPRFAAISNSTELKAYEDLLGPHCISFLQVTLDGPAREHDTRRIYADGSGSFAKIADNVDLALARGVHINARMNIDRNNIQLLPELAEEFVARGWDQHKGFSAYVAPIHPSNAKTDTKSLFNSWQLGKALEQMAEEFPSVAQFRPQDSGMLESATRLFDNRADPLPGLKSGFCGAHSTMYVIDAFGDIYACWERTGDPRIRVGTIDSDGQVFVKEKLLATWRNRNAVSNKACRKCRYASYCGGGCAALAENVSGTLYRNYCDGFGQRFRASVAKAYGRHVSGAAPETGESRACDM